MSRKNKFKKRYRAVSNDQNQEAKPKKEKQETKNEYNVKAEFRNLAIIIFFFLGALVGLYYYDQQTDVLAKTAERLMNLLSQT